MVYRLMRESSSFLSGLWLAEKAAEFILALNAAGDPHRAQQAVFLADRQLHEAFAFCLCERCHPTSASACPAVF
ncbi:unnamed protein product [Heligmosomoides polygyrus]|uniref:HEPN domain-containing protein n=1 Tax=Heligmosomoides polygyrus TaxID=6339 RepID=A0A183FD91_HELPZ|nr:unnamed protein product [Heligmosomoides polygyrus]